MHSHAQKFGPVSIVQAELFSYADFELPEPERLADRTRYSDGIVAHLTGYRPLMLDIDIPPGPTPAPVVVWLHGGAWTWGTNKHVEGPFSTAQIRSQVVAAGIAFAAAQYRLSAEANWPAQLHDVKSAIRWLRHHSERLRIDPRRIAAWGESAGGHLACLLATTGSRRELEGGHGATDASSEVAAAISWYGPTDLTAPEIAWATERLLAGNTALAREASPLYQVDDKAAPVLLVHGTHDTAVSVQHSERLAAAYAARTLSSELVRVTGAGHSLAGVDPAPFVDLTIDYLQRKLTPNPSPPQPPLMRPAAP